MKSHAAFVILALAATGCVPIYPEPASRAPITGSPGWFAGLSLDQARSLPADEAKAILIARAAVEARMNRPANLVFRVERDGEQWIVGVSEIDYFEQQGRVVKTFPPQSFACHVFINRDWSVTEIKGCP